MAKFKIDLNMNDVKVGSSDPVPSGEYLCEVLDADVKDTSKPGRCQIALTLSVMEPEEFRNRRIFDRRNIPIDGEDETSFSAQQMRELFDAMPDCFDPGTGEGDTDAMKGKTVYVVTKVEERKDRETKQGTGVFDARVKKMMNPEAVEPEPAPAEAPPPPAAKKPAPPAPKAPSKTVGARPFKRPSLPTA